VNTNFNLSQKLDAVQPAIDGPRGKRPPRILRPGTFRSGAKGFAPVVSDVVRFT